MPLIWWSTIISPISQIQFYKKKNFLHFNSFIIFVIFIYLLIFTDGIKPFSYYAVFVTTLIIRDKAYKSENIQNAASKIEYYQTPEGKPDTPEDINVKLIDYSKVNITWTAPARPNGIIENYVIEIEHHDIDKDRLISNHIKCEDSSTSIKNIGADNINDNSGNNQKPVKPPNNNNNKIDPNGGKYIHTYIFWLIWRNFFFTFHKFF